MSRLTPDEENGLREIRSRLSHLLNEQPAFPEVVGDRRILRFYTGYDRDIEKATAAYSTFLKWRKEMQVDKVRQDILYGNASSASKFPHGKKILEVAPQLVISGTAVDKKGQPLFYESFNFDLKEVLSKVTMDEFSIFMTYALEYRSICLEQLSDVYEKQYLRDHPDPATRSTPYRVLVKLCTIKDLKGVSLGHLGADGRAIFTTLTKFIQYYPEVLGVAYNVNVPWIFNTFWFFAKGILDASTVAKFKMSSEAIKLLSEGLTMENIPEYLGGKFKMDFDEAFPFDLSEHGPLWYEGCPSKEQREQNLTLDTPPASPSNRTIQLQDSLHDQSAYPESPQSNKSLSRQILESPTTPKFDTHKLKRLFKEEDEENDTGKKIEKSNKKENSFVSFLRYFRSSLKIDLDTGDYIEIAICLIVLLYICVNHTSKLVWIIFPIGVFLIFSINA